MSKRHRIEEEFHDRKAIEGVDDFYGFGALAEADTYLWKSLGALRGKRVLEIGCGDGTATLRLAAQGAHVVALDISGEMVELTRRKAAEAGLGSLVTPLHVGGEDFELPDGSIDIIYGHSVLHHLNLGIAGPRLAHVLAPGGHACFLEPLAYNPVISLFRKLTPSRRTPTEKPMSYGDFSGLLQVFSRWEHREFYLVSLASFVFYYGLKNRGLFTAAQRVLSPVDRLLFMVIPALRRFAWVTVSTFSK